MKFALSLGTLNPSVWVDLTEEADRLGFDSVWMPEHLVLPVTLAGSPHAGSEHTPIPADIPVFDALGYLCFLAGRTRRIRLGTQVFNIGLRHPFVTARAVATLDVLSNGRVDFGVGASWLRQEWDAVGLDFDLRGTRVDEAIEVCRRLWSEDVVEHHGRWFDFGPVMFEPKPVQRPGPPLHVGGDGAAALRHRGDRRRRVGADEPRAGRARAGARPHRGAPRRGRPRRPDRGHDLACRRLGGRRRPARGGRRGSGLRATVAAQLGCHRGHPAVRCRLHAGLVAALTPRQFVDGTGPSCEAEQRLLLAEGVAT